MKEEISLDGTWALNWRLPEGADPAAADGAPVGPWPARVPGEVHWDLERAGAIDDPLFGLNAGACRWVDAVDWWYERTFSLPPEAIGHRVELCFEGLDTTADVFLNGHAVGHHDNMFVPYTIDVSRTVVGGENRLAVRLDCGLRAVQDRPVEPYNWMPTVGDPSLPRMWTRKAQFTFGWDWAPPRLLTCGIWRPVRLVVYDGVAIREPCWRSRLTDGGSATIEVAALLDNLTTEPIDVTFEAGLAAGESHTVSFQRTLEPGETLVSAEIVLEAPQLWWPRPLGQAFLYQSHVQVSRSDGALLDRVEAPFGIRQVALDQSARPEGGRAFSLVVNGVPVFANGANWAPADSLLPRMVPEKYEKLLAMAVEQNVNCLRIWGGGVYEDPLFYELCDRYGIMVWQDFMFACCYYPDDDEGYCREIRREAEIVVKQLRNHPCLVLWCGNNENQWLHLERQREGRAADRLYGEKLYDEILPEVCRRLDSGIPYWPGSPYGGQDPNSPDEGDRHMWNVGDPPLPPEERVRFADYAQDTGKFISEFGVHSVTPVASLEEFLPEEDLCPGSPGWVYHQNWFDGGAVETALRLYWRDPDALALDEYALMSQLLQAEALKFALEHCRRRKFACSGALYWMLSDCWGTTMSWATVDYFLRRKPSFYSVQHAFEPVLLSFVQEDDALAVWLTNDLLQAQSGLAKIAFVNVQTDVRLEHRLEVSIEANSSREVARLSLAGIPPDQWDSYVIHGEFGSGEQVQSRNKLFLAGFHLARLPLPPARLTLSLKTLDPTSHLLSVSSDRYASMVHLEAGGSVWVEDNYFDLLPGETRLIRVEGGLEWVAALRVRARNSAAATDEQQ